MVTKRRQSRELKFPTTLVKGGFRSNTGYSGFVDAVMSVFIFLSPHPRCHSISITPSLCATMPVCVPVNEKRIGFWAWWAPFGFLKDYRVGYKHVGYVRHRWTEGELKDTQEQNNRLLGLNVIFYLFFFQKKRDSLYILS